MKHYLDQRWRTVLVASLLINLTAVGVAQSQQMLPSLPLEQTPTSLALPQVTIPQDYLLGAGDQVEVLVFSYGEFTGQRTILPDGTITLPVIGNMQASGLTTDGLTKVVRQRLDSLLVDPVVTVTLVKLRSVVVNISGEVQRPGPLQLGSESDQSTLIAALSSAGGITQNADIRSVTIERIKPDGTTNAKSFDLWELLSSNTVPPDFILQDGDAVYVPRLSADQTLNRRLIARSSLAPTTVRVRVVGEVERPGEVQVPPDSTLSSAIAIAGGPTKDARLNQVAFIRLNEQGQIEQQVVDLQNLTDNYQIQDGDVLVVPERNVSNVLNFAGRLFGPIGGLINLLRGFGSVF